MELLWEGGTEVCSNGSGHMTKIAALLINGKHLKNLLIRNQKADTLRLSMQHWVLKFYQTCSNDDPGLTLHISWQGQIWSLMLLYWKKEKQLIFRILLLFMISKLVDAINQMRT